MRNVILQSGLDVSVPQSTLGQKVATVAIIILVIAGLTAIRWFQKSWGQTKEEKEARKAARKQKLQQSPAMAQFHSSVIEDGAVDLFDQVDALFDVEPEDTHTTVRGAVAETYRAVSVAWSGRVESIPTVARRGLAVAALVTILGAIAVSTSAVVSMLSKNPGSPTIADILAELSSGASAAVDIAATFPYAGLLWSLAFAYSILLAEWFYSHWYVVAGTLAISSLSIIALDWRLDEDPPPLVEESWMGLSLTIASLFVVWLVGASFALVGSVVGFEGIGNALGFILSVFVALWIFWEAAPHVIRRIREDLESLSSDTRLTAGYLLSQRLVIAFDVIGIALIGLYFFVGISDGRFSRVVDAFLAAEPEVQGVVLVSILSVMGLAAYIVAESWSDVRAALHAAFAQKAVRMQLVRRAIPGVVVIAAYTILHLITNRIAISFALALLAGFVLSKLVTLLVAASYHTDCRSMFRTLLRPEPMYVGFLAYTLSVDGRRYYLIEVNGQRLLSHRRGEVVRAAVDVGRALATSEKAPATDEEWQAKYLMDSGITDPDDWIVKHRSKIREEVFDYLRSDGPRVTRDEFDDELSDFADETVQQALAHDTIRPYITLGSQVVSLSKDPYRQRDETDWPSLSKSGV